MAWLVITAPSCSKCILKKGGDSFPCFYCMTPSSAFFPASHLHLCGVATTWAPTATRVWAHKQCRENFLSARRHRKRRLVRMPTAFCPTRLSDRTRCLGVVYRCGVGAWPLLHVRLNAPGPSSVRNQDARSASCATWWRQHRAPACGGGVNANLCVLPAFAPPARARRAASCAIIIRQRIGRRLRRVWLTLAQFDRRRVLTGCLFIVASNRRRLFTISGGTRCQSGP